MLKDLILKNRSYRGFRQDKQFTKEELMELVDHARLTASSLNKQALKYYLVWKKDEVDAVQKETKWAKALKEIELPHEGKCPTAFIVIMQDKDVDDSAQRFVRDVGIAAQTILLAAVERGWGGCMIGSYNGGGVRDALNIPEHLQPMLVVALGEPDETIVLKEIENGESTTYYRDENDVHYVPKRKLEDIIVTSGS